jgi:inner membrane protein
VLAQQHVARLAQADLAAQGVTVERLLVTPTPFNTVLWRVVAISPDGYREGFRSLLDDAPGFDFVRRDRHEDWRQALAGVWAVDRMAWFTQGFYAMAKQGDEVRIVDLRMGQAPVYSFDFVVADDRGAQGLEPREVSVQRGGRPDVGPALAWLWRRLRGERVAPPQGAASPAQ